MSRSARPRLDPAASPKILLIRLRRIGDVVMTTPAVTALRRALPRARISYVVEEPYRRLVEGHPAIDRIIVVPAKQTAADFVRFIRKLRRETFDAVIDFHGGPRASRIAWLARGRLKVGYRLKYKGWIYDVRVPRTDEGRRIHSVENHLNLVRALGIEIEKSAAPALSLPEATAGEKTGVDSLWAENALGGARVVALHVGAGNEFRDWGEENLAALARRLTEIGAIANRTASAGSPGAPDSRPVRVVLLGGEGDAARAGRIAGGLSGGAAVSLAGSLNLVELREAISRAALFIGPDSGPMHIAASTRRPIVALFGPTHPENFAPWRAEATIVSRDLDCRPCRQHECVTRDFRCLRGITVEEVLEAAGRYL